MYVSSLDRPWLETPFLFQGFPVKSQEDIDQLRRYCKFVYIDIELGLPPAHKRMELVDIPRATPQHIDAGVGQTGAAQPQRISPLRNEITSHPFIRYETTVSREEELGQAREDYGMMQHAISNILDDIRKAKRPDIPMIKKAISPMIESVLRNPDAFMWLAMMKNRDNYSYNHSLNASVLATNFGRTLGLSKAELIQLAMGALLFDVGKAKLPQDLLNKPARLTPEEFEYAKRHVEFGIKMLEGAEGMTREVMEMASCHHERHDGSGYPRGLQGGAIPPYGKIASIVDCYDAIISQRPYAPAMSPYEAASRLYDWRDMAFQAELVEQFIQSIGIFPTGTLVELSTGQVGVVIAQNRIRRLRPKIMLVLDEKKEKYGHFPIIDLIAETADGQGRKLEIAKSLEPGSHGIDTDEFYL
ncbi:MAG: hypothetical protein A2V90_09825 [Gammaproteobacteria bacterium RBG_16_57_12]|nr:MAG: hypothetical protein A2V90_09825 [Gammaproteobacteria bacterium RBG_16_57_12]